MSVQISTLLLAPVLHQLSCFFLWSGQRATVRLARVYIEQVMSFEIYNDCIYFTSNKCWSNLKLYTITMLAKVKSNSTNCWRLYCYFNFQVTPAPNQFNFWHRKINWYSCVVNVINCECVAVSNVITTFVTVMFVFFVRTEI